MSKVHGRVFLTVTAAGIFALLSLFKKQVSIKLALLIQSYRQLLLLVNSAEIKMSKGSEAKDATNSVHLTACRKVKILQL